MKASLSMAGRTVALVALVATVAESQTQRQGIIVAPNGPTRVAGIAPPPPPPRQSYAISPSVQLGETVFGSVPAIVLGDGRVLADFGYGYEQIARPCPYAYGYGCQSYGGQIAPFTPIGYHTPQYMPPAYGAPVYPGAGGYYNQPGYNQQAANQPTYYGPNPGAYNQPTSSLPTSGYNANGRCPSGYVPTGGNPPCIDPVRVTSGDAIAPAGGSASGRPIPARGGGYTSARPGMVGVYRR